MKTWVRKSISVGVMAAGGLLVTQAAAQADVVSTGNFGIANGTQVVTPVQTAVDVCGNSIPIVASVGFAACDGGAVADAGGLDAVSAGNFGLLNGTQLIAPVQTAVDVSGNAVPILGSVGFAASDGGAAATLGDDESDGWDGGNGGYHRAADEASAVAEGKVKAKGKHKNKDWDDAATAIVSSGNYGILNGTQIYAPVQTAINICGNSIPILASVGFAACDGGAAAGSGGVESASTEGYGDDHDGWDGDGDGTLIFTGDNYGILNGTQVYAPTQTAVNICGNSIPILASVGFAACDGGAVAGESARAEGTAVVSSDNYGLLNGTQIYAPTQTAFDFSGNAIPLLASVAFAQSDGGAAAGSGGVESTRESARQEALPLLGQLPVVSGLPVVGQLTQGAAPAVPADLSSITRSVTSTTEGKHKHDDGGTAIVSQGNFGLLNGTQIVAPVQTAVDVSGNAVPLLLSVAFAQSDGGAAATF